jgi:hypothetical protein
MSETVHYVTNRGLPIYSTELTESYITFGDRIKGQKGVVCAILVMAPYHSMAQVFSAGPGEIVSFMLTNSEEVFKEGDTFEVEPCEQPPLRERARDWRLIQDGQFDAVHNN